MDAQSGMGEDFHGMQHSLLSLFSLTNLAIL
jgi:hypothetical protein